jgi:hypothetical protein
MTGIDVDRALSDALGRIADYARLAGAIHYQQSSGHITDKAMRAETGRLLGMFFAGSSATVGDGSSPAGVGAQAAASPARSACPPVGGPGTDFASGTADYASTARWGWNR